MCYTGLCPYEVTSGPSAGDCTVSMTTRPYDYPNDASCMQGEPEHGARVEEEVLGSFNFPSDHKIAEMTRRLRSAIKPMKENA